MTLGLSADATDAWRPSPSGRPGAPKTFSDCAIETALTLRLVFRLPVRQAEGFWRSVLSLMGVDLAAPDPTTLSRRSQSLAVACRRIPSSGPLHRIVDSTGLSIVGEGEWAAVHHGGRGHRGWKTLHRAVDRVGVIVAHALTEPTVDDATIGIDLIATGDDAIARVTADAAYETVAFYAAAEMRDATGVVPPSKTARVSRRRSRARARDRTITDVRTLGRRRWKQEAGYQLQARVEKAFFRYTSILGDRLRARSRGGRVAESVVACTVLNQMTELGRPESYSIGRCLASGLGSLTVSFESCTSAPFLRLRTFPLPVAPTRANVDGRRLPAAAGRHQGGTQPMTPHETGSTTTPGDARATAPPTCTFDPQGPTLGDLSDAYLQDYQVRQFRSHSTARGRVAHLTVFFGRAARAAALTTHQIRQYQLARRAAGAATGTINRETSALHRMCTLAVHWGWLDTVPGFPDRLRENPPRQGFFEHPEYLAVRAHLPAPWQDILDLAYYSGWRKQELLGLTWDEIDEAGGVIRLSPGRSKTLVGRILPISPPIAEALARRRARRYPGNPLVFHRDGIPVRRWRTAWRTACQAAGVPTRFLHDCRRTAARNLIRANVPERVAMLLTGHKSRAIFDRYNIINEQELLDAGDQLVAYLAQQAQAVPARQRPHAAGPASPRTAPPLRLVRRGTA